MIKYLKLSIPSAINVNYNNNLNKFVLQGIDILFIDSLIIENIATVLFT